MSRDFAGLEENVIRPGLCTACGSCVAGCRPGAIEMGTVDGEPVPRLTGTCLYCGVCQDVCPGRDIPVPDLEMSFFGRHRSNRQLGQFVETGHAHASDAEVRRQASSGGVITALLQYALEHNMVDGVVVTNFDREVPWKAIPVLARTAEEVLAAAQSKYATVPVNALIPDALAQGCRRLAVVGLPCQVHGLRKIQHTKKPRSVARRIQLVVGMFCAGQIYLEGTRHVLRELAGIEDLDEIQRLEYRGNAGRSMIVTKRDGQVTEIDRHIYMHHFLQPGYRRDRCMVCLDWSAELADISVGEYLPGQEGISVYLARSEKGHQLLQGARSAGFVELLDKSPQEVLQDTLAKTAYELKKHADAFRYVQRRRHGQPVPDYHLEPDYRPEAKRYRILSHQGGVSVWTS